MLLVTEEDNIDVGWHAVAHDRPELAVVFICQKIHALGLRCCDHARAVAKERRLMQVKRMDDINIYWVPQELLVGCDRWD